MTAKILDFPGSTLCEIPPDKILENNKGKLRECVLVGFTHDDEMFLATSKSSLRDVLWLLELARKEVLRGL